MFLNAIIFFIEKDNRNDSRIVDEIYYILRDKMKSRKLESIGRYFNFRANYFYREI